MLQVVIIIILRACATESDVTITARGRAREMRKSSVARFERGSREAWPKKSVANFAIGLYETRLSQRGSGREDT